MKFIPLKLFINISGQNVILPFYHLVSDEDIIHVKHLYNVRKVKEFERDLEFFLKEYNPLDISELVDIIRTGSLTKKRGFLLSFDDGLREFSDVIAPILIKKGIPAICFLNSGFIDNKDMFFRYKTSILIEKIEKLTASDGLLKMVGKWAVKKNMHFDEGGKFLLSVNYTNRFYLEELAGILNVDFQEYLKQVKPYMTSIQVLSLMQQGFSFGAHSINHPHYSDLTHDQQLDQTLQSIHEITNKFNPEYKLFAFPFTDYAIPKQFFNSLYDENHKNVDLTFGCAGLKKDEFSRNIQRIPIETKSFSAQEIIYGEYLYYIIKILLNKNTIKRY